MLRIGMVFMVVGVALLSIRPVTAGPTQPELENAIVRLSEVAPYLSGSGQIPVTERQRGPLAGGTPNFQVTYDRAVFVLLSARFIWPEHVQVLLVDASAGPAATALLAFDCRCMGVRTDQSPPPLGQDTTWYTIRADILMYDVLTWRQGEVLVRMVVGNTVGGPPVVPIAAVDLAHLQQTKLLATFPPPTPPPSPMPPPVPSPPPVAPPMVQPPVHFSVHVRAETALGKVLTDPQGMTLYTFDQDRTGESTCGDVCITVWPPLLIESGDPVAPEGLPGPLGVVVRVDGGRQITIDGRPLYRFSGDAQPGETAGDGIDGVWHAVVLPAP